jgi:hypothetical protein
MPFVYLTLAMDHSRVSFLYAPVDDKPKNFVETVFRFSTLAFIRSYFSKPLLIQNLRRLVKARRARLESNSPTNTTGEPSKPMV